MMHKPVSYAALLLASQFPLQALADTDVYLTNNSPDPVQLEIRQSGSGELQAGSQWIQHRTELGPWESAMVLSFNRYEGVKAGKSYLFETRVTTPGGDTYRLNQRMEGTWWNSTLQHGGETPADSSGWQSDRAIHRLSGPQELAFAAKFTGRYDDLHYMLTPPKQVEQPDPAETRLKVASYNVWALPVIASSIGERLALLPEHLKGYDALLLQEVFDGRREGFLQALAKEYPYQTKVLDKPGVNIHDGGVVIVSRYPIVREASWSIPVHRHRLLRRQGGDVCGGDQGGQGLAPVRHPHRQLRHRRGASPAPDPVRPDAHPGRQPQYSCQRHRHLRRRLQRQQAQVCR
ncbi:endonuclease/exonuclease/phosphatase family protein [Aeromonas dhakensis]